MSPGKSALPLKIMANSGRSDSSGSIPMSFATSSLAMIVLGSVPVGVGSTKEKKELWTWRMPFSVMGSPGSSVVNVLANWRVSKERRSVPFAIEEPFLGLMAPPARVGSCSARSEADAAVAVLLEDAFRRKISKGLEAVTRGTREERLQWKMR